MHIDIAEKCMEAFKENKLLDLVSVEQACLLQRSMKED